jgi:hypothetical protein
MECHITYFTDIKMLTTRYELMFYKTVLLPECLITYWTTIGGAHHYVCVDVTSGGIFDGMPFYILQT